MSQDWQALRPEKAHSNGDVADDDIINDSKFTTAMKEPAEVDFNLNLTNVDRSVGARIAGVVAGKYGDKSFAKAGGNLKLNYTGTAG